MQIKVVYGIKNIKFTTLQNQCVLHSQRGTWVTLVNPWGLKKDVLYLYEFAAETLISIRIALMHRHHCDSYISDINIKSILTIFIGGYCHVACWRHNCQLTDFSRMHAVWFNPSHKGPNVYFFMKNGYSRFLETFFRNKF